MLNTCKSNEKVLFESFGMIIELESGERVSNAWVTCPMERDSPGKLGVRPHIIILPHGEVMKYL